MSTGGQQLAGCVCASVYASVYASMRKVCRQAVSSPQDVCMPVQEKYVGNPDLIASKNKERLLPLYAFPSTNCRQGMKYKHY